MGTQATEAIRGGDGPNRETPIIAVTANAMKGDIDKVPRPLLQPSPRSAPLLPDTLSFACSPFFPVSLIGQEVLRRAIIPPVIPLKTC